MGDGVSVSKQVIEAAAATLFPQRAQPTTASYMVVNSAGNPVEGLKVTFASGRTVVVLPATLVSAIHKAGAIRRLAEQAEASTSFDVEEHSLHVMYYIPMAACSQPETPTESLPTWDEVLNLQGLTEEDVDAWYTASQTINPQWFPDEDKKKSEPSVAIPGPQPRKGAKRKRHMS